jgi:hypothetical protein
MGGWIGADKLLAQPRDRLLRSGHDVGCSCAIVYKTATAIQCGMIEDVRIY